MKYKRLLSALLAITTALSAAACSGSDSSSAPASSGGSSEAVSSEEPKEPIVETVGDLDYSDYIPESGVPAGYSFIVEAEECELTGDAVKGTDSAYGQFSGSGYAYGTSNKDPLTFTFNSEYEGRYDVIITAARGSNNAQGRIEFGEDGASSTFGIPEEGKFCECVVKNLYLKKGEQVVAVTDYTKEFAIDSIEIVAATGVDLSIYDVSHKLSNPNASDSTQRLYNFMVDIYGKYTLTGQYSDSNKYPLADNMIYDQYRTFAKIDEVCGDLPAILGLDLMECSPSRVENGSSEGEMFLTSAKAWDKAGGIVTLAWHWNAPSIYLKNDGDNPWYKGFYTEATKDLDLAAIMADENSEGYKLLLSDIDAIAAELQKLEDADIPVLWRPLHEAGGDPKWNNPWFWWGSGGADAYKKLWVLMYDRLTDYWGLDNLIWVWNGQNIDWYPGDEYCDMISFDIYADAYDYDSQEDIFNYIKRSTDTNKIIALSENGVVFDVDTAFDEGARWSWFAVWSGEYSLDGPHLSTIYTSEEQWIKSYQSERALTLSELPDWKSYPLAYED